MNTSLAIALLAATAFAKDYCLVFRDDFDGEHLNTDIWTQENTLAGGGNNELQWYTTDAENTFLQDGILYLKPTFTADVMGENKMISGGVIDLGSNCTRSEFAGCRRESNGRDIINPIRSGHLSTLKSHSIKYGRVEVSAKSPAGQWLWPAIWMLPRDQVYGGWPRSGEIDIFEAKGDVVRSGTRGRDFFGSTLHWGTSPNTNRWYLTHNSKQCDGCDYSQDFRVYGLEWTSDYIKTYLDTPDNVVFYQSLKDMFSLGGFPAPNIWPNQAAPFDQEFYLILNLAVGGTNGYFDKSYGSHLDFWKARSQWEPTWGQGNDRAFAVDSVKMWKEC